MGREFQITSGEFDEEYSQVRRALVATLADFKQTGNGESCVRFDRAQVSVSALPDEDDADSVKVRISLDDECRFGLLKAKLSLDDAYRFNLRSFYIDLGNPDDDIEETVRAIIDMSK